ncbi:MAG: SixA phosphatase family protein [Aureliella sp.]
MIQPKHVVKQHFSWSNVERAIKLVIASLCLVGGMLTTSGLVAQGVSHGQTTTFIIVRHAEREGNLDKLTAAGEERSRVLSAVGSAFNVRAIYSTDTERTKNTVKPLSLAIETQTQIYGRPSRDWLASIQKKHAGQVVLIVGHSNTTGVIAGLLAETKPFKIDHDEYDALFIVQQSDSGTQCTRLRYGSSSEGAQSADVDKMGVR